MAECILMQGGGGVQSDDLSATSANVLNGKTYMGSDTDSDVGTGTMQNNGAVNKTYYATTSLQTYTVPQGYHNGSGKVNVGALSQNNFSASNIKKGVNIRVSNGANDVFNATGTLAYTPHLADFKHSEPNNNYDYNETWTVSTTGIVYFKWNFSTVNTSNYFVYRNGIKVSNSSSGSFEVAMNKGDTIRWGYSGAHASSDHYGSVNMITMTTV